MARSGSKRMFSSRDPVLWLAPRNARKTSAPDTASQTAAGQVLRVRKRLVEVGEDVVCIFTPYGEPEQARRHSGRGQLLGRVLAMAGRRGVVEDRVDPAEARCPPAKLERVHEALPRLPASCQLEGEHSAVAGELAPRELVLRVAVEAGVQDRGDLRMALEEARDGERVLARPLEP